MRKKQKRPTRRKPDRPIKQDDFSIINDYEPPWTVTLYGLVMVLLVFAIPALMSWTKLQGWW